SLKASGVELRFDTDTGVDLLQRASAQKDSGPGPAADVSGDLVPTARERRGGVTRLEHAAEFLVGRTILWVQTDPDRSNALTDLFQKANMKIESTSSFGAAIRRLQSHSYDLIIADTNQGENGEDDESVLSMINMIAWSNLRIPVILYQDVRFDSRVDH